MSATTYTAATIVQNMRNMDGTDIIERDCGHKHRTIDAAVKCWLSRSPRLHLRKMAIIDNETGRRADGEAVEMAVYLAQGK